MLMINYPYFIYHIYDLRRNLIHDQYEIMVQKLLAYLITDH